MPFNSYANLQLEILAKLLRTNDSDAITRCASWITLAEDEIRMALTRMLVRQGETTKTDYNIAAEYNDLPTNFYRGRTIKITSTTPHTPLEYVPPSIADSWDPYADAGTPKKWTIQNNQLRVTPPPDQPYVASFTHYALTSLSDTNTTNWLLIAHPKLYFKAALAEAYDYYDDFENRDAAIVERDRMISAIYTSDGSDQQGTNMRVRVRGGTP